MSRSDARESFTQALRDDDAETLYDRAPCGYLSTDPSGLILKVNQTFLTMTGYQRNQLVGQKRFADLLSVGARIYHDTHYAPMLHMQGSAREIAVDLVRSDGTSIPTLVTSVLERGPDETPSVIRTAVFDATYRRQYEEELLRATRRAERSEARARELAATLQASLIPPVAPHIPGLDLAAAYHPAGPGDLIGGDFYDVYQVGREEWIVALGDVSGKGVQAAIVTALVRHTLRALTIRSSDPAYTLNVLNDVLFHDDTDRFCTLVLIRLRPQHEGWMANITLAGHPAPVLCRAGQPPTFVGRPGSLVGALPNGIFHAEEIALVPGDTLLLYTDGVTEARHDDIFYGETRLPKTISAYFENGPTNDRPTDLVTAILDEVLEFHRGGPSDDIALLSITVPR